MSQNFWKSSNCWITLCQVPQFTLCWTLLHPSLHSNLSKQVTSICKDFFWNIYMIINSGCYIHSDTPTSNILVSQNEKNPRSFWKPSNYLNPIPQCDIVEYKKRKLLWSNLWFCVIVIVIVTVVEKWNWLPLGLILLSQISNWIPNLKLRERIYGSLSPRIFKIYTVSNTN